jgi:cellulose synthase/poly-beta-1,6-N-acetylglucosamine synthase-like glycosyltransferase
VSAAGQRGTPPEGEHGGVIRGVSLICTLYNEAGSVAAFLDAVYSMEGLPEEFVIVDGGSTDGTAEAITGYVGEHPTAMDVRLLVRPECNRRSTVGAIAKGRNVAIASARHDLIAVTDCGCMVERDWLRKIVGPLLGDPRADIAGGWYLPDARTSFERCLGNVWLVPPGEVDPGHFLPSSRSLAFRRSAWEAVGGYPEHTYYAEDTLFDLLLRQRGYAIVYVPDALVRWRMKSSVGAFAKLVHDYGYGDGSNAIMASSLWKSAAKVSLMLLFLTLAAALHPAWLIALVVYRIVIAARRHGGRMFGPGALAMLPCAMVVKAIADVSYLAGHLRGRFASTRTAAGGGGS